MKWLVIIDKYTPEVVGGHSIYVERFIKELIKLGNEVTLLTTTNKKEYFKYEKFDNLEIYKIYIKKGSVGPLRFNSRNLLTQKVLLLLDNNNFDVVNTHTACLFNCNW